MVSENALNNREKAHEIVMRYRKGLIDFEQLNEECKPILDNINETAKAKAKAMGIKYSPMSIGTLIGRA